MRRVNTGTRLQTRAGVALMAVVGMLMLTACGSSEQAATPQATVTVTAEPTPEPEVTVEEPAIREDTTTTAPFVSEADMLDLLLTDGDITFSTQGGTAPFLEDAFVQQGPLSYATYDTVQPPACAPMLSPFAGTAPDPQGVIQVSAYRLLEEEKSPYIDYPITVIQIVDVFSDEMAARSAFESMAPISACTNYTYDDGQGPREFNWTEFRSDTGAELDPADPFASTHVLTNSESSRVIGLTGNYVWGLIVTTGHALEPQEVERLQKLVEATRAKFA